MTMIEGFPLSPVQRSRWATRGERLSARLALAGSVDHTRLADALAVLAGRHEVLRCAFAEDPELGVPMQYVDDAATVPVVTEGDVPDVPLAVVLTTSELVLSASPLAVDAGSLRLLVRELAEAYAGRALPDDEERTQFIDVSEWQNAQAPYSALGDGLVAARPREPYGERTAEPITAWVDTTPGDHDVHELVLAAWLLALAPRVDADHAVLAWYDDGRGVAGSADVVGPLGTHVPVRLSLTAGPADVLTVVRRALSEARRHSLVTIPADATVTAGFSYRESAAVPAGTLPVNQVSVDGPGVVGTPYLACEFDGAAARLTLHGADVALLDSVVCLLETLPAAREDATRLRSVGAAELARIIELSGDRTARRYGAATLTDLLDTALAGTEGAAVVAADGTVTFTELSAAADAVAGGLAARGVGTEDRVVVLADRSWRTVANIIGVLRAGAVYVPVDPSWPRARIELLTGTVKAVAVIGGEAPAVDGTRPDVTVSPSDAAYVIFTSGSTGVPRPVVVEHAAVVSLWHALTDTVYSGAGKRLRVAVNAPLTFDASIKQLIQLASGHTLVLLPEEVRRDGRALLDHLVAQRCDVLDCTPSHLRIMLDEWRDGDRLPPTLLLGGEAVDAALWRRLAGWDGVRAVNLYGPTECTVDVTADLISGSEPGIGRPLSGARVWILDAHDRPVPLGAVGELCVGGDRLARGYEGDDAATAARFATLALPDGATSRIYRTGDLVRFLPDGRLSYVGRTDNQVKINGYRVEPDEVAAVLRTHPAVSGAAVVPGGEPAGGLHAYAVPHTGPAVRPDRLAGVNPHETAYLYDEIFVQQVYHRHGITLRDGAVVFDVGANIGMFSLFALAAVPDARVYAFEPLSEAFRALRENLAGRGDAVTLLPYGLSDAEHEAQFAFYPGYAMMSGRLAYADPAAEVAVVKRYLANRGDAEGTELLGAADELLEGRFGAIERTARLRRLSDVLDELHIGRIDLLKIDVQRAEEDVLRGLDERHWPLIAQIVMEVHDEPGTPTEGRTARLAGELERRGLRVVTEQENAMAGTGRYSLYAIRPEYRDDPRPARSVDTDPRPAASVDPAELRGWLAARLPEYLVPNTVTLLDALPLTAHGKLDRAALPVPASAAASAGAAPANAAERALLEVWSDVLGRDDIGVEDPFFQHGGDSIRAIRVRAAAARRGLLFPLRDLIRHQTIRRLVAATGLGAADEPRSGTEPFALVAEADRAKLPPDLEDAYPATALQLAMLYHRARTPQRPAYEVVTRHRFGVRLDEAALRSAFRAVTARHPILRTSFDLGTFGEPLQLVHRQTATPMVRYEVTARGDDAFDLVLRHFHGVLDGWSLHLFLHELCQNYDALLAGRSVPSRSAPMPYRRFVELERGAVAAERETGYWRALLTGARPMLLAGTEPSTGDQVEISLPPGLGAALAAAAAGHGVPLKSLLLAVHAAALGAELGRDDVLTGLVVSGRPGEEGADQTLGLFLNTVPVRLEIAGRSLAALAADAWRAEQDIAGHHAVPLAAIEREARAGRLFDSFFNFTRFDPVGGAEPGWSRVDLLQDRPVDVAFGLATDFEVLPGSGELRLTLQYDGRLVGVGRIASLVERYRSLLDAARGPKQEPEPAGWQAPETPITVVWRELTGSTPAAPGARFGASGGDSLLALRFVAMLYDRYGISVPLAAFRADDRFESVTRLAATAPVDGGTRPW
jgi:amino acid adenylation domain-containing protein/FkbM family methyltransferase